MYRWKGSYSDKQLISWDVYDGTGLVAYAIKRVDGKWKVRVNHLITKEHTPHLILDDDPKIFMPHLLITLVAAQRDD